MVMTLRCEHAGRWGSIRYSGVLPRLRKGQRRPEGRCPPTRGSPPVARPALSPGPRPRCRPGPPERGRRATLVGAGAMRPLTALLQRRAGHPDALSVEPGLGAPPAGVNATSPQHQGVGQPPVYIHESNPTPGRS